MSIRSTTLSMLFISIQGGRGDSDITGIGVGNLHKRYILKLLSESLRRVTFILYLQGTNPSNSFPGKNFLKKFNILIDV